MTTEVKSYKGQTLTVVGDDYEFITGGPPPEGYSAGAGEVVRIPVGGSFSFLATEEGSDSGVVSLFRALTGDKVYSSWAFEGGGPVTPFKMTIITQPRKDGYHVFNRQKVHVGSRRRKGNADRLAKACGGHVEKGARKGTRTTLPVRMASTSVDGSVVSVGFSVVGAVTRS